MFVSVCDVIVRDTLLTDSSRNLKNYLLIFFLAPNSRLYPSILGIQLTIKSLAQGPNSGGLVVNIIR